MNSFNPNYFIHACNILMLVAYCVRDILWLRLFAVAASLIAMPYFVLQPAPLWVPLAWSGLFAAINGFQSWRLFLERRPVKLTPEEEEVRRAAFPDLSPRNALQIFAIGSWTNLAAGGRLLERGKLAEQLSLIVRGKVQVKRDEQVLGEMTAGEIVGSAMLLTGTPAEVDAVVSEPVRVLRWESGTLERFLNAHPDTRIVLQRHLARDLAGKLQRLGKTLFEGTPPNPSAPGAQSSPEDHPRKD